MTLVDPRRPWDLRQILDLDPLAINFTCIGINKTLNNSRCRRSLLADDRQDADELLNVLAADLEPDNRDRQQLSRLARYSLCREYRYNHQDQAEYKALEWLRKIELSALLFRTWREMQVERENLVKKSLRLEEELASQSTTAASAMERVEAESTGLAKELLDLRAEHARLNEMFHNLQEQQTESETVRRADSEDLAPVEKEVKDKKLRNELPTVNQEVKEREPKPRDKLAAFKKEVKERETKLRDELARVKEEAKDREMKLAQSAKDLDKSQENYRALERKSQDDANTKDQDHARQIAAQESKIVSLQRELELATRRKREKSGSAIKHMVTATLSAGRNKTSLP